MAYAEKRDGKLTGVRMQRPKPQFHIVTAEQRIRQYEAARQWMIAKIEELKLQGFVLNEQTGHWEHPNGDQAWLEG